MTVSAPGPEADLIEHAAGIIVRSKKQPHTAPYHWAGALWEEGMLVAPGTMPINGDAIADDLRDVIDERNRLRAAVDAVRAICDGVRYKVPGDSDTYGPYPEGRHDLSGEIESALDAALGTEEAASE